MSRTFLLLSIAFGFVLILLDILLDNLLFYGMLVTVPGGGKVPANELFMRVLLLGAFCIYGVIASRVIHQMKQAEKKKEEDSFFLQQLLNAIPAPIFYKDNTYVYLGCNDHFALFLGMKKEDIIGRTVHEIAPEHLADIYHAKDRELLENPGVQIYESQVRKSEGRDMNVIFHKATFHDMNGELAGMIGVILDITELRTTEAEKEATIAELQDALREVKTLSGLLPICASCKKIRDDSGFWQRLEKYIRDRSHADFSHSICPDCARKLVDDYANTPEDKTATPSS